MTGGMTAAAHPMLSAARFLPVQRHVSPSAFTSSHDSLKAQEGDQLSPAPSAQEERTG